MSSGIKYQEGQGRSQGDCHYCPCSLPADPFPIVAVSWNPNSTAALLSGRGRGRKLESGEAAGIFEAKHRAKRCTKRKGLQRLRKGQEKVLQGASWGAGCKGLHQDCPGPTRELVLQSSKQNTDTEGQAALGHWSSCTTKVEKPW